MTSVPEKSLRKVEQVVPDDDFESLADDVISKAFADEGARKDTLSLDEKRIVIKELALASSFKEIVSRLNSYRAENKLPSLHGQFDLSHYRKNYGALIDDVAMLYAKNLAKKFRFADRLFRIAKLSELAEHLNTRIQARKEAAEEMKLSKDAERAHNEVIKLLSQVSDEIDTQMGKVHLTKIDISVKDEANRPVITNAADVKELIADYLKRTVGEQLPNVVDANFSEVTDYTKCGWSEDWTNMNYCRYHGTECKVATGEISVCPFFLNKGCITSKEWLTKTYVETKLSVKAVAELAGCKEVSPKVLDYVRGKLKDFGVERPS